jgi:hypothetical protein
MLGVNFGGALWPLALWFLARFAANLEDDPHVAAFATAAYSAVEIFFA